MGEGADKEGSRPETIAVGTQERDELEGQDWPQREVGRGEAALTTFSPPLSRASQPWLTLVANAHRQAEDICRQHLYLAFLNSLLFQFAFFLPPSNAAASF